MTEGAAEAEDDVDKAGVMEGAEGLRERCADGGAAPLEDEDVEEESNEAEEEVAGEGGGGAAAAV